MLTTRRMKSGIAFLAIVVWLAPARPSVAQEASAHETPTRAIDVAMSSAGALRGMVVDGQGAPCAERLVTVRQQGKIVAQARSNAEGRFEASGLRGGAYLVVCHDAGIPCRLWSAEAAPPAANQELLIPESVAVARGQNRFRTLVRTVAIVTAVGAAIAIPIVLITQEDDRRSGS